MIGLHVPESGTISFDGAVNTQFTIEQKRQWRQEIGMVFQGSALFDSQTVQENVMFPLKMFKKQSQEEMIERVNFVLKRVNLENSNFKFPAGNLKLEFSKFTLFKTKLTLSIISS